MIEFSADAAAFDDVSLDRLYRRKSEKWAVYPRDVLPAWVAEMDFAISPNVRRTLDAMLDIGDTGYAWETELPEVFCDYAAVDLNWSVMPEQVFTVPDVMAGVSHALLTFTQRGAGVVVNPPVYFPFFEVLKTIDRQTIEVPLRQSENVWELDFDGLERAFAGGAEAYLLCNPHNPVGRVWSERDVRRICDLAQQYDVLVVSDEIHAPLTMPDVRFTPVLSVASDAVKAVCVISASKAWNLAGLKCGLAVAGSSIAEPLARQLRSIPTDVQSRVGHLGNIASAAAFREDLPWLRSLRCYLNANRTLLGELLRHYVPAARYTAPQATYLAWVDCRDLALVEPPASFFLHHGRVALEEGTHYGAGGDGFVRINFGTSAAILEQIVKRMGDALVKRF